MRTQIQLRFGLLVIVLLWVQTVRCAFGSTGPLPKNSTDESTKNYYVLVGSRAPQLEIFAANELCRYLDRLYGLELHVTNSPSPNADFYLLVGSPTTNPAVARAVDRSGWPKISD